MINHSLMGDKPALWRAQQCCAPTTYLVFQKNIFCISCQCVSPNKIDMDLLQARKINLLALAKFMSLVVQI